MIRRRDIKCMQASSWLNDEVINLCVALLQERNKARREAGIGPDCYFHNTFFVNKLFTALNKYDYKSVRRWTAPKRLKRTFPGEFDSILELDRIIIPVHLGIHWVCAVISLQDSQIWWYDSLGVSGVHAEALKQYVHDEYEDKLQRDVDTSDWEVIVPDVPQQLNGHDCGVFTLMFAEYSSRDVAFNFQQKHMQSFRAKIVADICHHHRITNGWPAE
eukprot:jgi/Astpho2/5549/e_gw1.00079.275.1_t